MSTQTPDLLTFLQHVVELDTGVPGFTGSIAIGVQGPSTVWWQAAFDKSAHAEFVDEPSANCDAILLMGQAEAASIVKTGHLPPEPSLLLARGDRTKLSAFVRRYVQSGTPLTTRLSKTA